MTIAALFVATNGCYFGLPDVDPWDAARDARLYAGPHPVVAHPPCSVWCQLAHINQKRYGHRVGDDGGCFSSALSSVRRFGGVLEHPAKSYAWAHHGLVRPERIGWSRDGLWSDYGSDAKSRSGWVCEVSQAAYGHRARKATWLYCVGAKSPEPLNWLRPKPTSTVSYLTNHGGGDLPRLSKNQAQATPPQFRDLLISIARDAG